MATIFDLRKTLEDERSKTKSHQEIESMENERKELEKQIKEERNKRKPMGAFGVLKHDIGKVIDTSKPIFKKIEKRAVELRDELDKRDRQDKAIRKRGLNNNSFIFGGR